MAFIRRLISRPTANRSLLFTFLALARRAFALMYWFALATLLAGALVWFLLVDREAILPALLAAVLLIAPGLVLLHALRTLQTVGRTAFTGRRAPGSLARVTNMALLLRPWYWAAVAVSLLAGLVLVPAAIIVALRTL